MVSARGDCRGRSIVRHDDAPTLIRETQWTAELEAEIAAYDEARNLLPYLRRDALAGVTQLWNCSDGRSRLLVATRLELELREWVIVWVHGNGLLKFGPRFVELAQRKGWRLRMHTTNAATARLCARLGFRLCEYVSRL